MTSCQQTHAQRHREVFEEVWASDNRVVCWMGKYGHLSERASPLHQNRVSAGYWSGLAWRQNRGRLCANVLSFHSRSQRYRATPLWGEMPSRYCVLSRTLHAACLAQGPRWLDKLKQHPHWRDIREQSFETAVVPGQVRSPSCTDWARHAVRSRQHPREQVSESWGSQAAPFAFGPFLPPSLRNRARKGSFS